MMDTQLVALWLMAAQGCLGAFDTLFHHELTVALPRQDSAVKELAIHATRATIYSLLFIGLSAFDWNGLWATALFAIFAIEIVLTLWDFVVEDRTRLLPATERVTHTVLAINGGAFIAMLAVHLPQWLARPTALAWHPHGYLSLFLALCGAGVGVSGIRDAFASASLAKRQANSLPSFSFSDRPRNILVTGGTGFIGQRLVWALLLDGHDVTILTRRPRQAAWRFDGRVRCIRDMRELSGSAIVDIVINLAGARILGLPWTQAQRRRLLESRLKITGDVVAWIARAVHKPELLLSASAVGFYGVQQIDDETPLTESAPPQPMFMSELCRKWEDAARAATLHGVKVVATRFGLVFGRKGALPMMMMPIHFGLGGRLGSGRQWMSWVHVDDVLGAIAHLCRLKPETIGDAYNFTAPEAVTQSEFAKTAARIVHRPAFVPTPGWPMRLAMGEQADLLLEGQRVVPKRLLDSGFVFAHPTLEEALRNLI